jgi:hypothetical protein
MCDNKPSRINMNVSSTVASSNASSIPTSISTSKSSNKQLSLIDTFYDNRKNMFDICGNIINKEKYPFITILSTYLLDIVNSIDIEINKSTRNSMINWREKKNPKLLSKFINSDDNINIINRSMNKITSSNYMTIVKEITDTLTQDNFRKLPEYSKFLFDTIIKKCLNDEKFATDYLHFLVAFDGVIGKNINQYINDFITEAFALLNNSTNNNIFKCNDITLYFSYIKDVSQYMNIGIILANLYLIKLESNSASANIKMYLIFTESIFYEKFISCLNHINNYLEWLPADMTEIIGRIYLLFGIIEIIGKQILELLSDEHRNFLNDILTLIYNVNSIPNKIKFKVLDIQDMIKSFNKTKQSLIKQTNKIVDIPVIDDTSYIDMPSINLPKKNKPVNFSTLKLVQMNTNKTSNDLVPNLEINNTNLIVNYKEEVPKLEVPRVEVSRVEVTRVEVPRVEIPRVEVPRVEVPRVEVPRVEILRVEIPRVEGNKVEGTNIELNNKYDKKQNKKNNKNNDKRNNDNRNNDNRINDNRNNDNRINDNRNNDNRINDNRINDNRNNDNKINDNKKNYYRNNKNFEKKLIKNTNSSNTVNPISSSSITPNSCIMSNTIDDDGFIKIERKSRPITDLQNNNKIKK